MSTHYWDKYKLFFVTILQFWDIHANIYIKCKGVSNVSDISKRLRECIENKHSYKELEKITGIPKSAIQRYASGTTEKIPMDRLGKLANALGVSTAYLMGWEPDEAMKKMTVSASEEKLLNGIRQLTPAQQETLLSLLEGAVQNLKGKDSRG